MSLFRLVYHSAFIAGWAAFLGWLLSEWLVLRTVRPGNVQVIVVAGMIGAAIGLGINAVAGMANGQWKQLVRRSLPGLLGGFLGGAIGGMLGNLLYAVGLPRGIGWLIMGLGIGVVEGVYERSLSKIRNGFIGGGIGGLLGGILFDPLQRLVATDSGMSSRATAFVILGICIGALIGLAQVVLKEAWLTVLDGYRAGRQLILSGSVTTLGRAEHLPLPFLGPMNKDLELEHVTILRQSNGVYTVEDNKSTLGTRLNNQPLQKSAVLKNGDVIKFGTNFVRFNERPRKSEEEMSGAKPGFSDQIAPPPPPPAVRKPATAPAITPSSPPVVAARTSPQAQKAIESMPQAAPAPPAKPTVSPPPAPKSIAPPPPPPRRPKTN